MSSWRYHRPATVAEAVRLLDTGGAVLLAGGQTLVPALARTPARSATLVDLGAIAGLRDITASDAEIRIGAMATHTRIATDPVVRQGIPSLARLAFDIADPQVRNRATIGGSVAYADPAGDYPAACLGLSATVITDRRRIPAAEYFTGAFCTALTDSEMVVALSFPTFPQLLRAAYVRLPNRTARSALVGVMVAEAESGFRVAVGGLASGPLRWPEAEAALDNRLHPEALQDLACPLGASDYLAHMARALAVRAVQSLAT
ncbi:FAD binding domain-containing protein [Mycobacterium attenuatum]|uniref:FAD binding domain-containing protein n=1 Tax=Mycobacterium attenuatum TaxID=2341086 RepID=UPI000F03F911|nr:FAD binding domain-containing protein [Mycobacterium attenuatum]VBA57333.1 Carbon monoxide dehydrogenase medium chain [Mycobacterium attenuatum]